MLLQLPRELRDQIYTCLFASTRFTFGKRPKSLITGKMMKPAPNGLAILRTCRQINQEAGDLWLRHVLFSFESSEYLLDKLSTLPSTTLSQIRHVRTGGRPLMLRPIGDIDDVSYRLVWVLKLLRGLRLDKLTVLGPSSGGMAYDTLDGLIRYGNGWRELRFITPNSTMIALPEFEMSMGYGYRRKRQPGTWDEVVRQRDGASSGASITVYRSTQSGVPGTVTNSRTRQIFEQKVSSQEDLETEDEELLKEPERGKELLVVVKRGRAADIAEQDRPPYNRNADLRRWAHGMTWAEIRHQCLSNLLGWLEDYLSEADEIDSYNDVDEYAWNPACS